jgi:hypothetical protein
VAAETNLQRLMAGMQPVLNSGEYVFCTVASAPAIPAALVVGSFREAEGLTLILPLEVAQAHGLPYEQVMAWLTLNVHSSLAAVGMTAAVAAALTKENISCNVVAAFYHDHLFVAQPDAQRALAALQALSAGAAGPAPASAAG